MMTFPPCEFRDPDGSYLLVQPLDEVRCRVLASNVALKGEVVYKADGLSWTEAEEDLGGCTRIGPAELLHVEGEDRAFDPDNLLDALDRHEDILVDHRRPDPEEDPVDPRTLPEQGGDSGQCDPQAEVLRLAIHYQKAHERKEGQDRWVTLCNCPEFQLADGAANARLHTLISIGLLKGRIPTLPRIWKAIQEVEARAEQVA